MLENFSISVSSGERVGLKAPSGRGKTTLCRLLAGYEKPAKGQVLLDGRPVREYRGVCPVQMVWQHPETVVDPLLTLGKTLNEAGAVEQRPSGCPAHRTGLAHPLPVGALRRRAAAVLSGTGTESGSPIPAVR